MRRHFRMIIPAVAVVCLLPTLGRAAAVPLREITPQASDDILMNPGMGVYLFGTLNAADMPADAWFAPAVTIGYFRDDWSKLQPDAEGVYKFDEYFNPIFDLWVKKWKKRVSFRFMSENMHSRQKYVTPKWVFETGVPSVTLKGLYVPEQVDPVFWDEKYLAIQERFIADLGKYLDGRPGLEFIDIGCIGEWGEMHLARWTPELLQQTGYTETRYIGAYRRIIDAFARAFPRTRVFLNVGDYDAINDYAAIRGLHFRQDGLNPSGPSANVGKRFYHPYSRRGVICNYELHSGYSEMKQKGWGIPETFKKGLEDPISYFHINLMGYRELLKAPAEVRDSVTDLARRLGFRFVLARVKCNEVVRVDGVTPGRLLLDHTWRNAGVAPCYDSYALRWSLVNDKGVAAAEGLMYPKRPTTQWWPGEEAALRGIMSVPANTPAGAYRLKVAMLRPEQPDVRVALGIAGRDTEGRYDLGEIAVQKGEPRQSVAYEEGFENGVGGWQAAQGITLRQDEGAHAGKGCLLATGTQAGNAWNYASYNLPQPLLPASRYRFSCWMKVDSAEPAKAPYLKIGLADAAGKWITNCTTNTYDLAKVGAWQLLQGFAETTPETAGGHMAIEKGALEQKITVTIRLDDVKVELLESP
ncbi:MAG: carbohydrate binding domain-containing protein [Planctomycetota bacterium]|nr:carbohydrate binding domain-containing protein [Planctomycetota bacterium]